MQQRTHLAIDPILVGAPVRLGPGEAEVQLTAAPAFAADERGLVHGGFTFGLADYAAMLAVNDPTVVLGGAETRFLAPCVVGETLTATARVIEEKGKKRIVEVKVATHKPIFEGTFTCFVLERHVLDA